VSNSPTVPVIGGLAVGICFVLIISIWSAFSPLNESDFAKRANANVLVRSFLQIFPDAYISVQDISEGSQSRTVLYTVSMPWSDENQYDIPVYLRALFSERGYPIIFHIHCQPEGGSEPYHRISEPSHTRRVIEQSEDCQKALEKISK